jgi:hypothetical protein
MPWGRETIIKPCGLKGRENLAEPRIEPIPAETLAAFQAAPFYILQVSGQKAPPEVGGATQHCRS